MLAVALSLGTWPACAQATEPPRRDPFDEGVAASRIAFIQSRLDEGTASARWWWYGWLGGYSVATIAQGAVGIATHDHELRATMLVGAGGSALGAIGVVAMPFPSTYAAGELRASTWLPAPQRQALALDHLESCADAEQLGRSWLPHALGVAVAAAQGLVLWVGFDQPRDAAETAAVSLLISEAQIFTQPMRAVDDLESYRHRFLHPPAAALRWRLTPSPGGLALRAQW